MAVLYAVLCNCVYQREESTSRRSLISFGTMDDVGLQKVSYYSCRRPVCAVLISSGQCSRRALLGFTISILIGGDE